MWLRVMSKPQASRFCSATAAQVWRNCASVVVRLRANDAPWAFWRTAAPAGSVQPASSNRAAPPSGLYS